MFKLEESKAKTFEFEYRGETYSIPSVDGLPLKVYRKIRKAISESDNPEEAMFDEIMGLFDEYIPDVMDVIDFEEAKTLFIAYSSGDGASLGES